MSRVRPRSPSETVPGVTQLDSKEHTFYQVAHHSAIRAILEAAEQLRPSG